MHTTFRRPASALALLVLSLAAGSALAQATAPGQRGSTGTATTPTDLPPGATSARGNKAAVPASGASAAVDPMTGSTAGQPPGATSTRGDKAQTPKGKGTPSGGSSAPRS